MQYLRIPSDKFKHYPELQRRIEEAYVPHEVYTMVVEGEPVGVMVHAGERIIAVVIKEEYRRMGYGTDFVNQHLNKLAAGKQEITVALHDSDTLAFLFKLGFRNAGTSSIMYDHRPSVKRLVLRRTSEDTFATDDSLVSLECELNTLVENLLIP